MSSEREEPSYTNGGDLESPSSLGLTSTVTSLPVVPMRRPPPTPLAIATSSAPSTHLAPQNIRNSLDSSRSDLTSIRSELTSLRISEFPLPPSILPTIPASPATPKSLFFTTTPTSATVALLQEPAGDTVSRSRLPSPKTLKGFFTRSNNNSQTKLVSDHPQPHLESSEVSDHASHSIYRPPVLHNGSRAPTPTTAGTMTPREWPSESSGRTSPLVNNNRLSSSSPVPSLPSELVHQPSISPPPQSPLPPLPSNRSSVRTSFSYSQILHHVGAAELGMDITEEKLLSTDFITEMLGQPTQSPEQRFPGITLQEARSMEKDRQEHTGNQPITPSGLTVIDETGDMLSPSMHSPNLAENEVHVGRMNSVLASSVFPSGGDMIYYDSTTIGSPSDLSHNLTTTSSTLGVPNEHLKLHRSPHPLVPSTPMTPGSFTSLTSPKSPFGMSSSASSSPTSSSNNGWSSSVSQMVASRLPIGRTNSTTSTVSTQRTVKPTKIRQHRYPRNIHTGNASNNSPESVPMQDLSSISPIAIDNMNAIPTVVHEEEYDANDGQVTSGGTEFYDASEDVVNDERRQTVLSIGASARSHATSTKTQRDSIPVMPTVQDLYDFTDGYSHTSELVPPHSAHSIRTRESGDETEVYVGIAKAVDVPTELEPDIIHRPTSPKVVGVAPARVIQPNKTGSPSAVSSLQPLHMMDEIPKADANPPVSPVSPRNPPSTRSPPSHRTDIPESAKSLVFSDEVDDVHPSHLPYETRSSGGTYWTMFPGIGNNPPVNEGRSTKTNAATSFKSIVSYITSRSATRGSHKSGGNRSSKWAWLLRKPLPPLPLEAQDQGFSTGSYHPSPLALPVSYEKSKLSPPPGPGVPQGWDDFKFMPEKRATGGIGLMGKVFGEDSLKIAKRKPTRKPTDPYTGGEITPYVLPHLSGMHRPPSSKSAHTHTPLSKRRKVIVAVAFVAVVVVVIIVVLAVLLSRKQHSSSQGCSGANVGTFCNLDATCTCPSGGSGICTAPLAKALSQVVPQAAQIFNVNITSSALAIILWEQNGTPVNSDCSAQAELLDVGQAISPLSTPNRTSWAESALIWTLFETGSVNTTKQLQSQILKLPFNDLTTDGVMPDPTGRFVAFTPGYTLDFANQTANPPPTSFVTNAAPSTQQLSEINPSMKAALDRMYSFAIGSSTQTQAALTQYWQNVLLLDTSGLPNFLSAIRNSAILLPFDASSTLGSNSISNLLGSGINGSVSFPPPIACYPGLSNSQLSSINLVETQAFGLPPVTADASSTLDPTCFINRPVYGVLDVFRLRLPFPDGRKNVALQAAVLNNSQSSVRTILHAGELLSALPGVNTTEIHTFNVNPREFGTLTHINHVALQWLQSFPSVDLAVAAAEYLSQSPTSPPPHSSPLLNATVPIIEVALFGEVLLSNDISSLVSSFSTPTGELFFGSPQGEAFRRWALQSSSPSTITWTSSAVAQQVVVETQTVNSKFENVWSASGKLIASGPTNSSSVQLVMNALNALGLLST